jgi:transcription termination/antitermination protein NusG
MGEACVLESPTNEGFARSANSEEPTQCTAQWYALKVRTRAELAIAEVLRGRGFHSYCPVQKERLRYSDRMKTVETAVFPGYVFCHFDATRKVPVISSPGVEYIVGVAGAPIAIPENEIKSIQRAIEAGARSTPYIREGQRVTVTHGPLSGVEGIVAREGNSDRVVVSIDLLSRSVSLHIESDLLQPVS